MVRVRQTFPDGTAQVIHIRESACPGDCHRCGGCAGSEVTLTVTAQNPIGAATGDLVTIRSDSGPVLRAGAAVFCLPLGLFFLGFLAGAWWNLGAAGGCAGFLLGILGAVLYDRRVAHRGKTMYTITGFAEISPLDPMKKGDNSLD